MTQATEKQIKYAHFLKIPNPEQKTLEELKVLIDEAKGNTAKPQQQAPNQATGTILTISDKPHSYEFGKPGSRHKIYYNSVEELINHINLLKKEDLVDDGFEELPPTQPPK